MQSKRNSSIWLIVFGLALVVGAALYWVNAQSATTQADPLLNSSDVNIETLGDIDSIVGENPGISVETPRFIYPIQLSIPDININTRVVIVGLDDEKFVVTPPDRAGFWDASTTLINNGNSVIVGHNKSTPVVIFRDIGNVRAGMIVEVTAQTGNEYRYAVSDIEIVQVEGVEPEEVQRVGELMRLEDGQERLTIVTCYPAESCAQRIIVIARPVPDS